MKNEKITCIDHVMGTISLPDKVPEQLTTIIRDGIMNNLCVREFRIEPCNVMENCENCKTKEDRVRCWLQGVNWPAVIKNELDAYEEHQKKLSEFVRATGLVFPDITGNLDEL